MTSPDSAGPWYVRDRGRTEGPYSVDELRKLLQTKRLARHHLVSSDGASWHRAAEALPAEVFNARSASMPSQQQPHEPQGIATPIDPFPVEPQIRSASRTWSVVGPMLVGVVCIAAVVGVASLFTLMTMSSRLDDDGLRARISPSLVTMQGLNPQEGKSQCFGLLVSKQLIVAPIVAATLSALKAQVENADGKHAWHTAYLLTADPHTKLCVLRVDAGSGVSYLSPPDDRPLPNKGESLRMIKPGKEASRAVEWGTVKRILNDGEPDEMIQIDFDYDSDASDAPLGRTVVTSGGGLVAMVVGRTPDGGTVCVPASEIRVKKKDAAGLPADHVMEPIAPLDHQSPPRQPKPQDVNTPSEENSLPRSSEPRGTDGGGNEPAEAGRAESETEAKGDRSRSGGRRDRKRSPLGVIAGVTKSAAGVIDDSLPDLPKEKATDLGEKHLRDVLREHRVYDNKARTSRVRTLADEVIRAAGRSPRTFTVTFVENEETNAYAFVGNNIVINTGFLDYAGADDDMIVFVLAHEVGHIVEGHVDLPFRRMLLTESLAGLGSIADDAITALLKNSPYNQAQEEDADCYAVRLLRRMNRSTAGGVRFFRKRADEQSQDTTGGRTRDETPIPDLFSSHPDDERRIELITGGCEAE
jgi:hypothetical protein